MRCHESTFDIFCYNYWLMYFVHVCTLLVFGSFTNIQWETIMKLFRWYLIWYVYDISSPVFILSYFLNVIWYTVFAIESVLQNAFKCFDEYLTKTRFDIWSLDNCFFFPRHIRGETLLYYRTSPFWRKSHPVGSISARDSSYTRFKSSRPVNATCPRMFLVESLSYLQYLFQKDI